MVKEKQCKKNCDNCDSCKKHQEHAFELEVDEDLRQERLSNFWKKYRWLVYGAVALILGITAGVQVYQSWRMKTRLAESDVYENAVIQLYSQNLDEAVPALESLAHNGRTGYRYMAQLQLAGVYERSSKIEEATQQFKALMDSDAPQDIRHTATLSYINIQLQNGKVQELKPLLEELMKDPNYVSLAAELMAAVYVDVGQIDEAKQFLQSCMGRSDISDAAKVHLGQLKMMLENK